MKRRGWGVDLVMIRWGRVDLGDGAMLWRVGAGARYEGGILRGLFSTVSHRGDSIAVSKRAVRREDGKVT
jgi:hypothetical protein